VLTLVMDWLLSILVVPLGCNVVRGFPTWSRASNAPPVAAVELWYLDRRQQATVGAAPSYSMPSVQVTLFGANEPGLWDLVQRMATWLETNSEATVGGRKVRFTSQQAQRYISQTGAEQEAYGFQFTIVFGW
jgi:hypothetical protein